MSGSLLTRAIIYFGQPCVAACDARCSKAWGISARPHVALSEDPDDIAFLSDEETGEAPADPGTYEGGHGKPSAATERLNKWCVRQCERSALIKQGSAAPTSLPDFSHRLLNRPRCGGEASP